ncbi:hypothetical protein [Alcanivorax sediminis]|uniref:Uncharacterized protein n=1 Tax=Alcanivorax sediminis TaxID=2663008 RepID=A0A6N7LV62_9GAMM|nr:hypothetical protein [Alcanivorax sediminis]MQX53286.1 hypothetical protein [Alcanivorax sediminis]
MIFMKGSDFFSYVYTALSEVMSGYGFSWNEGDFYRERSGVFRDLISFDPFDAKFRVIVGVNYPFNDADADLSAPPDGALLAKFYTGASLSDRVREFPVFLVKKDPSFLNKFVQVLESEIIPFLDSVVSPEIYADKLSDEDCVAKYQIYKMEGLTEKAKAQGWEVLKRYKNMRDIEKIDLFIKNDVEPFLKE